MKKCFGLLFVFGLFFSFSLVSAIFVDNGEWFQTVNDCGVLNTSGSVYTFGQNISLSGEGNCLNISAEYLTIEGNGFSIVGSGDGMVGYPSSAIIMADGGYMGPQYTLKNFSVSGFQSALNFSLYNLGYYVSLNVQDVHSNGGSFLFSRLVDSSITNSAVMMAQPIDQMDSTGNPGILISSSARVNLQNVSVHNNYFCGLKLASNEGPISFINSNFYDNFEAVDVGSNILGDDSDSASYSIVYENSFGKIEYLDYSFLNSLGLWEDLYFPGTINILNNSIFIDPVAFTFWGDPSRTAREINSSANITLYGVPHNLINPQILINGSQVCNETTIPSCYAFTLLNDSTVIFNISSLSSTVIDGQDPLAFGLNYTLDDFGPEIVVESLEEATYTSSEIPIKFSATDISGVSSKWFNNGTDNITYSNETEVNLSDGNYTFSFYANDTYGNINRTEVQFAIDTYVSPLAVADTQNLNSGGSGNYFLTKKQMAAGIRLFLSEKAKTKFKVENETHLMALLDLDFERQMVTLNVSSDPQIKTISVGEEWKVNLDSDDSYDISIELVNISKTRAEIYIRDLNEQIPQRPVSSENLTSEDIVQGLKETPSSNSVDYKLIIISLVLAIILVAVAIYFLTKKRTKSSRRK